MLRDLVDIEYYNDKFEGSSIPNESSFVKYAREASSKINYYTCNRIVTENDITDLIRDTTCKIAELLFKQASLKEKVQDDRKEIASETLGPRSVSYVNKSSQQFNLIMSEEELEKEVYKICYQSLVHTGLMYRGQ